MADVGKCKECGGGCCKCAKTGEFICCNCCQKCNN